MCLYYCLVLLLISQVPANIQMRANRRSRIADPVSGAAITAAARKSTIVKSHLLAV